MKNYLMNYLQQHELSPTAREKTKIRNAFTSNMSMDIKLYFM